MVVVAAGLEAEGSTGIAQPAGPVIRVEVRLVPVHLASDRPREAGPN